MPNSALIPSGLHKQALAFPSRVDQFIAENPPIEATRDVLAKGEAYRKYLRETNAGTEFMRPLAFGLLKLRAHAGSLIPPTEKGGRGKKKLVHPGELVLAKATISAYRKLAVNRERLEEYYEAHEDVPTQTDFIRFCGSDGSICTKHGNGVIEWYTPAKYLDAARTAMGSIDLDPATSSAAQKRVQAETFYTAKDDGLSKDWSGNVFLNPPYKMPLIERFCFKLCDEYESKAISQAVLLVNDNTDTKWWPRLRYRSVAVPWLPSDYSRKAIRVQGAARGVPTRRRRLCVSRQRQSAETA